MGTSFTIIDAGESAAVDANVEGGRVRIGKETLRDVLGWELKPEGLCRGSVCVPVRDRSNLEAGSEVDLQGFADALARPLALDVEEGVAVLGAAARDRSASLAHLEAPEFRLPDLDGKMHSLAEHRGKKVLLVAYASW